MEFAPQILDHPSNLVVRKDQPATMNCRADGNPAPAIEWYRNGKYVKPSKDDATAQPTLLPDGSLFFLRLSQEKGKSDEGVYHCLARNHLGKATSKNASLYLEGKAPKDPGEFAVVVTFRKKPCSPLISALCAELVSLSLFSMKGYYCPFCIVLARTKRQLCLNCRGWPFIPGFSPCSGMHGRP